MKQSEREKLEAIERLHEILKPGDTVYTVLTHVPASGMSRSIQLKIVQDGDICDISYHAARALGAKIDAKHDGIKIGGCGMDMGFALVNALGRMLWPSGTPEPHGTRNGEPDSEGGYALKQEWI